MKLLNTNITIASVESFTGGSFSAKVVSKPGASKYFKGALVTYWNEIKEKFNIDTKNGVVNEEVARVMAMEGKKFFQVDYCFAFTGNAGPSVLDNKDPGLIYIAINEQVFEFKLYLERNEIIKFAVDFAYDKLLKLLKKNM
ncbi:CinA family protein [Mesomycoplasma neurolyticum]|uniref:Competence/damage-inducible protein CinA n=1 Tax=Mesomycoplasma neurolyticum TaxID=2120 RepID=A0A449A676_9BACT|nr:nicotinamide-nucleotide amidohydrolase family protein [Mesomycoplasma neurolyticum]VEU59722.1 competence/damage-inducible protein CinA [Mesomycoplasma neurolyticum]